MDIDAIGVFIIIDCY